MIFIEFYLILKWQIKKIFRKNAVKKETHTREKTDKKWHVFSRLKRRLNTTEKAKTKIRFYLDVFNENEWFFTKFY